MALEHFTAILAHELLANPRHLAGADPATAELWRWHAAEEIEHKGVAYDTWLHATRDWTRCKRWKVKAHGHAVHHPQFPRRPHRRRARAACGRTGSPGRAPGRGLLWTMWVSPGCCARSSAPGRPISCPASIPGTTTTAHLIADYEAGRRRIGDRGAWSAGRTRPEPKAVRSGRAAGRPYLRRVSCLPSPLSFAACFSSAPDQLDLLVGQDARCR